MEKKYVWILDSATARVIRCEVNDDETAEQVVEQYCEAENSSMNDVQWMENDGTYFNGTYIGG